MGVVSLVHVRFGILSPSASAASALSSVYSSATTTSSTFSSALPGSVMTMHSAQNSTGTPVSTSCTSSFARSACHGTTGSDCASHRFFPSSDTEGAAISFIDASRHSAALSSTGTMSAPAPNASSSSCASAPPLISSAMPAASSIRMPRPQLSI